MKILFFDTVCPSAYDPQALSSTAMGGTEATVVRIAEALSSAGHTVDVAQRGRLATGQWNARYIALTKLEEQYDVVVILRDPKPLAWARKKYSKSKLFLWLHDENYQHVEEAADVIRETNAELITVSRYHQAMVYNVFLGTMAGLPKIHYIYNPVVGVKRRVNPPVKLRFIYFSSPHKGLKLTLEQFKKIRGEWPEATLKVANPGYYEEELPLPEGAEYLGKLTHDEVIEELGTSWAVLHCNSVFPETFGLVHAEANAIGVPCIAGGLGANRETLKPYREQVFDITKIEQICFVVNKWLDKYPEVRGNPEFELEKVVSKWNTLIQSSMTPDGASNILSLSTSNELKSQGSLTGT